MREHLRFRLFFNSKSDPGQVCIDILTSLEVFSDLGNCKVFIQLYSAIAMLSTCPRTQGTEISNFPTLIVGPAGARTRATCVARSGGNRSAIHYNSTTWLRNGRKDSATKTLFFCTHYAAAKTFSYLSSFSPYSPSLPSAMAPPPPPPIQVFAPCSF
jgi:hypothetical protein